MKNLILIVAFFGDCVMHAVGNEAIKIKGGRIWQEGFEEDEQDYQEASADLNADSEEDISSASDDDSHTNFIPRNLSQSLDTLPRNKTKPIEIPGSRSSLSRSCQNTSKPSEVEKSTYPGSQGASDIVTNPHSLPSLSDGSFTALCKLNKKRSKDAIIRMRGVKMEENTVRYAEGAFSEKGFKLAEKEKGTGCD